MGRYAYGKFMMQFSYGLQRAIAAEVGRRFGIEKDDFDWSVVDLRVKRADTRQRHRFADTVRKLEAFLQSEAAESYYDRTLNRHLLTVSEMARMTGRNRKTIVDWSRKDLLVKQTKRSSKIWIDVESTVEKLRKSTKISR